MKELPEDLLDQVQSKKHCTRKESGKGLGGGYRGQKKSFPVCSGFEFSQPRAGSLKFTNAVSVCLPSKGAKSFIMCLVNKSEVRTSLSKFSFCPNA